MTGANSGKASRIVIGALGVMLAAGSSAHALTITRSSSGAPAGGRVECVVQATGATPISIVVAIVSATGTNVTDYGTGFRSTTDEGFYAEESAGSFDPSARSCKATVTGARKRNVEVTIKVLDAAGNEVP